MEAQATKPHRYNVAEVMVFQTCNFNCGYCGFVTDGSVKNIADLAPFRERSYIDKVFDFFEANSSAEEKWILHLSGGEPLLMPNLDYFCGKFVAGGHKLAFNTNLSIPIEKSSWIRVTPPHAVDAIIASLHQEALDRFDEYFERVRFLHNAGYPIVVRMVGHPLFIPRMAEWHERFRGIDVNLNVNPLYSPNYPHGYTEAEKGELIKYMKVNYEVIRMNGGVDMTGRQCKAGSALICVGLGISGAGHVYPCAGTTAPQFRIGNIFDGDVKLRTEASPCLRRDQTCSCAIHFTHGILPHADDQERQQTMVKGYSDSVENSWRGWFAERGIKTTRHESTPQGTRQGEKMLVLKRPPSAGRAPAEAPPGEALVVPPFGSWDVNRDALERVDDSGSRMGLLTRDTRYHSLLVSPPVRTPSRRVRLDYRLQIRRGGLTVGLMDEGCTKWITFQNHLISGSGDLAADLPPEGPAFRIALAACNPYGGGVTEATLVSLAATALSPAQAA